MERELERIKKASESALRKIQYSRAHNAEMLYAISIVEHFLRKKHRICYGGQAVNAHLPSKYQFYNHKYQLPDYDFFTPEQDDDAKYIINKLQRSGFQEIAVREGMHEGTLKIYVNFISIADITSMSPEMYHMLAANEFRKNDISYLDANSLRMLMYLELSRPRGEVERWPKVYERLFIFNQHVPWKMCRNNLKHSNLKHSNLIHGKLTHDQVLHVFKYIIKNELVFAGGDLIEFYRHSKKINWIIGNKHPIVFFSSRPDDDANMLQPLFDNVKIQIYHSNTPDIIPSMTMLSHRNGKEIFVLIIHTSACHSYYTIRTHLGTLRISSLDTLITLYFGLRFIKYEYFDIKSIECLASQMVLLSMKLRRGKQPFISLHCYGHQLSLPSLIRKKVNRMLTKRKKLYKIRTMRK